MLNTYSAGKPEKVVENWRDNYLTLWEGKTQRDQLQGVDITGGCSALLRFSQYDVNYSEVLQPGFTALKGKTEFLGNDNPRGWVDRELGLWFADQIKLFCPKK